MSPRPRAGLLLFAVAGAALFVPPAVAVLAAVVVVAATAADAWSARRRPGVERRVAASLARGVPAELTLVAAPGLPVRLRQPLPPDVRLEPQEGDGRLDGLLVAGRRGRHVLPVPAARVDGPLGLGCWYHRTGEELELRVYPDLPAARRLALAVRRGRFRHEGRARGPLGLGTEFESIRDYLPDDEFRQINWRATARLGRPMSNQFRVESDRDVVVAVDCGRLMAAPLGDRTRLDAALDATVAVAAVADELGDRAGAVAFDATVRRSLTPRRRGAADVVAALYDLEPSPADSDYERAFAALGGAKRAFVLVLTDLLEETAARPLLEALPVLARRHAVTVASVADPDLHELVEREPEAAVDVYRTVVALDVLAARERAAARLRAVGASVVEAPVLALPHACVRAYLTAKARARL